MAPDRLMFLLAFVLVIVVASDMSSVAAKKFGKNTNSQVLPKIPAGPPKAPLLALSKYRIAIHNNLERFPLDTHCFSKDDDFGWHTLQPYEIQDWSFRDNVFENTKFHCRIAWEYGYLEFDSFQSDLQFLQKSCGNSTCTWSARQLGVYLTDIENQFAFFDYWDMIK